MMSFRDEIARLKNRPDPRVTIVRAGALGDTILLLPAIELLLQALPEARLTVVGSAWAGRLTPLLPRPWRFASFDSAQVAHLFSAKADDDPTGAFAGADLVVIYTARSGNRFVQNVRRFCAGTVIESPMEPPPGVHVACQLAAALVGDVPEVAALPLPRLLAPQDALSRARGWIAECTAPPCRPLVVVHPGSGGRRKCWPPGLFAKVLDGLAERGEQAVLLRGPADREACDGVVGALASGAAPPVAAFESLSDAAALIANADAFLGNDSGIAHLAAALGRSTISVFGPTDPALWRPLGPSVKTVGGSPVGTWPEPEGVMEALNAALAEGKG